MNADEIRREVNLHDLAQQLGVVRPQGRGNYKSPFREDRQPSFNIFQTGAGEWKWKDHGSGEGGSAIDLVMQLNGLEMGEAMGWIHQTMGIPTNKKTTGGGGPQQPKSRAEFIADNCQHVENQSKAVAYLKGRGIDEKIILNAWKSGALGFNHWTSQKRQKGEVGHGGPAVAFIVRDLHGNRTMAVDLRYLDPKGNGGVKTMTQGEKTGFAWTTSWEKVARSRTVFITESAINGLSIESIVPGAAAVAIRGVGNAETLPLEWCKGKRVIIVPDNDPPRQTTRNGRKKWVRAGLEAAWIMAERLTNLGVSARLVDQRGWGDINDINDHLAANGAEETLLALRKLEPWAVHGLDGDLNAEGKGRRAYLGISEFMAYGRVRVAWCKTRYFKEIKHDADGNQIEDIVDVAGFRIVALRRISIASPQSAISGKPDLSPTVLYIAAIEVPRERGLIQVTLTGKKLYDLKRWEEVGPIFSPGLFKRVLNALEHLVHLGNRRAANIVGIGWMDGKPCPIEGPDCFFAEPEKQCLYHNLVFPVGPLENARRVTTAFQKTFTESVALMPLVWALGAHLKAFIGFWPHMSLQADKGVGKSTMADALGQAIGMQIRSGEATSTIYRLLTSMSGTTHPVGYEELSAREKKKIDQAVSLLQEGYQFKASTRGSELVEYVVSAPALLLGEDVPVASIEAKLVRSSLTFPRRGEPIPRTMPHFPVRQWLEYLCKVGQTRIETLMDEAIHEIQEKAIGDDGDHLAGRMVKNYSAVWMAWKLLVEFCDFRGPSIFNDLIREMNTHLRDTEATREPWALILEVLATELAGNFYDYPKLFRKWEGLDTLVISTRDIMHHLATNQRLRSIHDGLPIKTARVLKNQLIRSGVLAKESTSVTIGGKRFFHMIEISLEELKSLGIYIAVPTEIRA